MADANSTLTLNHETIVCIREALLIGLAAYGEIERLTAAQEIRVANGHWFPYTLRVFHPTGASDTVSRFADALRAVGQTNLNSTS